MCMRSYNKNRKKVIKESNERKYVFFKGKINKEA